MVLSKTEISEAAKRVFAGALSEADWGRLEVLEDSRKAEFLLENSKLDELEIARRLSEISGFALCADFMPAENAAEVLPARAATALGCMPTAGGEIAFAWIPDSAALKWLAVVSGGKVRKVVVAPARKLREAFSEKFGVGADTLDDSATLDFSDAEEYAEDGDENAAIVRFVNEIIARALAERATDIHIEPAKGTLAIRYRVDGNLEEVKLPENLAKFKDAIVSRVKIMARLNISEKRRPQDGRIAFAAKDGEEIDIRVSTLPTLYGESVSLRLLNQNSQKMTISDLGLLPDDSKKIDAALARPHGIILVTGPTGSGKSTSLTAFIRKIRLPEIRIVTVEDPVEYEVEGVNQTQVRPEIGLTFSAVLRSVLRQDPDIIMVGEIRDRETADIAIRASLTGHLVLSTLHTNDAAGALTRLTDMQIEPFLIASSVNMILAQRLVRRLCGCAKPSDIAPGQLRRCLAALGVDEGQCEFLGKVKAAAGCDRCRKTGYFGRVGIFEMLSVNEEIHAMVVARKSAREIRKAARAAGMRTMQECGWELVKRGETSLEEVMLYAEREGER